MNLIVGLTKGPDGLPKTGCFFHDVRAEGRGYNTPQPREYNWIVSINIKSHFVVSGDLPPINPACEFSPKPLSFPSQLTIPAPRPFEPKELPPRFKWATVPSPWISERRGMSEAVEAAAELAESLKQRYTQKPKVVPFFV